MSFHSDIPDYKSYSEDVYYMHSIHNDFWKGFGGLILRAANNNAKCLKDILNEFAALIPCQPTTNWGWDFLQNEIDYYVREIKKKVNQDNFDIAMDALSILVKTGYLSVEDLNHFLEELNIGYIYTYNISNFNNINYFWNVREKINLIDNMSKTQKIVLSVSQQAYEEINRAKKTLEDAQIDERARKDAVRSCVSAMEAIIKEYGEASDIKIATQNLKIAKIWGKEKIVKEGLSLFNMMHELYPDLRHGSIEKSIMSIEETEYWIGRISNFINYMVKMSKKIKDSI